MENYTYNSFTLQLEGLNVTKDSVYPVFLFLLFSYLFIIVANAGITALVFMDKNLHQPMYLLFWNLSFNDILGSSVILPRLLIDILHPPSERSIGSMVLTYTKITVVCLTSKNKSLNRKALQTCSTHLLTCCVLPLSALISYYECVAQAFTTHMFSTTAHTVLMIMAFDRYVAICNPLRYSAIMTNRMLVKLTVSAWGVAFILVGILLGLTIRLNRCRTLIRSPYCDNAALFKLSCESVLINNIYGFAFTVVLFTGSIGSMVLTYSKITVVCLTSKNKSLNSKALKTCSTHLVVYLIMMLSGLIVIILHRFPQYSDSRKFVAILFFLIPGTFNPIIYGMQSKEIWN
ncbi:hypothetical protein INR49_030049, partial [Caranx melampygus]